MCNIYRTFYFLYFPYKILRKHFGDRYFAWVVGVRCRNIDCHHCQCYCGDNFLPSLTQLACTAYLEHPGHKSYQHLALRPLSNASQTWLRNYRGTNLGPILLLPNVQNMPTLGLQPFSTTAERSVNHKRHTAFKAFRTMY